jgi:SAM-dependent methyltransferase
MMVCLGCGSPLAAAAAGFVCPGCPFHADRRDGIVFFEPDFHGDFRAEGLQAVADQEINHPWFRHRSNVILSAFAAHVAVDDAILDVGAGTGRIASVLREAGYRDISVGDLHPAALALAKLYGFDRLYQFDLASPPFRQHFDVVTLFDVVEHVREDARAVGAVRQVLRSGGRLVLTVPAHRWLWSRIDDLSGHYRRYDRTTLTALLSSAGFEVVECRYFFTALVPALLLRSLLSRGTTAGTLARDSGLTISRPGHALLTLLGGPGDTLLSPFRRVAGGSLLAIGRAR